MPDGPIEPRQAERFREIGRWLNRYGESIYGTRGGPFCAPDERLRPKTGWVGSFTIAGGRWWGGSTRKDQVIYLHILRWPSDSIQLAPIGRKIVSHSVLTGGTATVKQTDQGIEVSVPALNRNPLDTIVKLVLDGSAMDLKTPRP
jgi:alpha-L-fucosidase